MSLELLQDIHLSDDSFWTDFQYYWKNGSYTRALQILEENQELVTKYVSAEWFNALTAFIYQLETLPDDFNKKQIKVSYLPPDLEVGDIWFQLELGTLTIDANMFIIPVGSTSVVATYSNSLINAVAFKNNEEVLVNQVVDETNHSVTFSIGESLDYPVICMVYSTNNSHLVVNVVSESAGINSFTIPYSGALLSVMYLDQSNNRNMVNLTIDNANVGFSLSENTDAVTKGRVVYIPTAYLSEILNVSSSSFTTTSSTLLCDGYMVNCFVVNNSDNSVVLTDVTFSLNNAIIGVSQNTNLSLNCTLYYT